MDLTYGWVWYKIILVFAAHWFLFISILFFLIWRDEEDNPTVFTRILRKSEHIYHKERYPKTLNKYEWKEAGIRVCDYRNRSNTLFEVYVGRELVYDSTPNSPNPKEHSIWHNGWDYEQLDDYVKAFEDVKPKQD